MIIHCKILENQLIFQNNTFLLDGKTYNTLNEVLQDTYIYLNEELIIDASVIKNTTAKELWEFINSITKKDKSEPTITVYYEYSVIKSKEELERAKSPRSILIRRRINKT